MNLLDQLKTVAVKYADAKEISHGALSSRVFGDGTKLPKILSNEVGITVDRFERTMRWFSEHWPSDVDWPDGVVRPIQHTQAPSQSLEGAP